MDPTPSSSSFSLNPHDAKESFYKDLKPFRGEGGVSDRSHYVDVPESWHIVLSDVKGSTKAIQAGRYKDVNMVGAASIAAVCNSWDRQFIPYVFGGDGATFLIPESRLNSVMSVLHSVSQMSQREFGLELRVGSVSVKEVLDSQTSLKVAKKELSPKIHQAIFLGGALARAEGLIKTKPLASDSAESQNANYEGLECRWQPIESRGGEIISVLVRTQSNESEESFRIYKELIEEIELFTGGVRAANPSRKNPPSLTLDVRKLLSEFKVRQTGKAWHERLCYLAGLLGSVIIGKIVFMFRLKFAGIDWGKYKDDVVENSDFWKFDEMLRFVLDVSAVQKRALLSCLENRFSKNEIFYGIHSSQSALMTCLVFDREGGHIHFIDGNDGGYALAAVGLKAQVSESFPAG